MMTEPEPGHRMNEFHDWLDCVLTVGESVQDTSPRLSASERPAVEIRLRAAFELHALDVAGPPVAFDPEAAVGAAVALARACWLLVSADDDERPAVALDIRERSASAHLSADVTLRFLPAVYRRARLRDAGGALTTALDRLLRAWPLSGVLADLDGEPTAAPDFGHPGLNMLFAERLAVTRRAGWVPLDGTAREWAERVFAGRGLTLPELLKEIARD
jgi:MoxR-vWA-beta-propeller ternary system domain bpX4